MNPHNLLVYISMLFPAGIFAQHIPVCSKSNGTYSFQFTAMGASSTVSFEKISNSGVSTWFSIDNMQVLNMSEFTHYDAELLQVTDYSPFGAPLQGRTYNAAEELNKAALLPLNEYVSGVGTWSTTTPGVTVANASGRVRMQSSTTGYIQMVSWHATTMDKTYRLSVDIDRGNMNDAVLELIGYNNTVLASVNLKPGLMHYELDFVSFSSVTVKVRSNTGTGTRNIYVDNMKIDEVRGELDGYRFGFNGQEKDNEVAGTGNCYTAEFWQYDLRLGRRFDLDPVIKSWHSGFSNNPIIMVDPSGAADFYNQAGKKIGTDGVNDGAIFILTLSQI